MKAPTAIPLEPNDFQEKIHNARDGDVFEFQAGDYYLEESIHITGKHNLVIRAKEGATVNLHGGQLLNEWTDCGNGIWKAHVKSASCELYADGVRQQLARWPKEVPEAEERVYCKSTGTTPAETRKRAFKIDPKAFPTLKEGDELSAFLWPSGPLGEYNWHSVFLPCKLDGDIIELSKDTWFDLGRGTRFYLLNHSSFLTDEGEFHVDRQNLEVYFKPAGGTPDDKQIVYPLMKNIFEIRESSGIVLENLNLAYTDRQEFIDGEVFNQDDAAVFIADNSSNISVRDCEIHHTGLNGVTMYGRAQRVSVENCHIHNIGHTGVRAYGEWVSKEYMNKEHLVINNHIHHLGERVGQCAGVQLMQSGDSTIAHNLIHHSSRYAISLLSPNTRTVIKPAFFPNEDYVPSFMARWYTYTRNNVITRNEVYACCRDSQDTGLIHGFRAGENNVVSDNIVRDSEVPFSFGNGIYLDDCCDGWKVKNNLVYNLNHHGNGTLYNVLTLKGIGNIAKNNRFINNKVEVSGVISTFSGGTKENYNLEASRNIFHENNSAMIGNDDWQPSRFSNSDHNLVYESSGDYFIQGGLDLEGNIPFYKWQREGFDTHSQIGKAQFINEAKQDFRLKYTSPAWALGVAEINYGMIGLREDYTCENNSKDPKGIQRIYLEIFNSKSIHSDDMLQGRSWISCESGDSLTLYWYGRDQCLQMHRDLKPSLELVDGESSGIKLDNGRLEPLGKGIYSIKASIGEAEATLDLLVDEQVVEMRWASIPVKVVVGEKYPTRLVARTDTGREYTLSADSICPEAGAQLIEGELYFNECGKSLVAVHAAGSEWVLSSDVVADRVKDLIPEMRKIVTLGHENPVKVLAVMNSGRQLYLDDFDIEGEDFSRTRSSVTFHKEGQHKLVFRHDHIITEFHVRVVRDTETPIVYSLSQYGPEEGTALALEEDRFEIYSTANNIWWKADDATFMKKEMPSEGLEVMMTIESIEATHRFAQSGILVKAADTAEARNINFRVNAEGELMVAVRQEDGEQTMPILGASPWAKFGGNDGSEIDDRIADGVAFPVKLKLSYSSGVFSCFFAKDNQWDKLGDVKLQMPQTCHAGAAFFSVDITHAGMTRFSLDCRSVS